MRVAAKRRRLKKAVTGKVSKLGAAIDKAANIAANGTGIAGGPPPGPFKQPRPRINQPLVSINNGTVTSPVNLTTEAGTAQAVYQALIKHGLKPYQAAGIMGNIQNESSFQVENATGDQGTSFGLIQWHIGGAFSSIARGMVTGNPLSDFNRQISAIVSEYKANGVTGSTAAEVASSWAANVEGCQGCAPGGSQNSARMSNAMAIYQQIQAGQYALPKPVKPPASTSSSQFPGGYANWVKWWTAHPNATSYGGPGSTGGSLSKNVAGLPWPTVTPAADKQRITKAKTRPRAAGLAAYTPRVIAALRQIYVKAKPKRATSAATALAKAQNRKGIRAI